MRFTFAAATGMAFSASVAALPALSARASSSGCSVSLNSTLSKPANPGEIILMRTMLKWSNSTGMSGFSSSYANWSHTVQDPFSVFFYADTIPDYETTDELAAVLDPWVGTWLISSNSTPASGTTGDFNITDVTCV
ncbi:hypothetical protein B0J12DRAFT_328302 [Macrophomina phaseolina]|uniref:Uncharacterized protein n=1 Tax=Macrophomina phaseolina TaxID=35725 RepID=A0ABQ8FVD0_9PEZI|nr:hypothetical protein B0J12DRAFT_328302 [Macrophomina phaseolina]